ncbi:hypothetical protein [Alkalihalobacillus sp. LMS39]|uniref:hypothetical protein n=1 Tax=Alkalihalobacillus sp. LMS39 TaxID=2924032 RepID=UPI001FB28913|nr:hypothetical protein [Alkalihalobacillus sp. LMS39]UOE94770.1 hypothetical protein MM271_03745 [Alkalihalobacillus sp. LMS39]
MNHTARPTLQETLNKVALLKAFLRPIAVFSLCLSGILFFLYPALRPFSDEATLQGAAAFASNAWMLSHVLGIIAFLLLPLGLLGLYNTIENNKARKAVLTGVLLSYLGVGLTLPFYGAEVFALSVIGQEALVQQSASVLELANTIRFGPGFFMIFLGLMLLALGTILIAIAIWKSGILTRWAGIPLAVGFVLYLPQYLAIQPLRIAHGLLIAIGCIWIAVGIWKHGHKG